jgi:hypothetical protein
MRLIRPVARCLAAVQNVSGKVALVLRGICPFQDKIRNAKKVGAVGVIVYT